MEESAGYRWIFDKGRRQGMHSSLEILGGQRFGEPSNEVVDKIRCIRDLERLLRLGVRLLHAESWEDLLGTP
jgi:hypothetical protein